ncbi:MAG: DUF2099 family protein [Oscillospiraceae bacterium]|nr:DUF2099 family protein [Oscillospiraceae bacterium]
MTVQVSKKHVPVEKYFTRPEDEAFFQTFSFAPETPEEYLHRALKGLPVEIESDEDTISFRVEDEENKKACMEALRGYYETYPVHITRMFGSYVLLVGGKDGLRAVRATQIPIRHCPLMKKLLTEVGGATATGLLERVSAADGTDQNELMCELINDVVIDGGYFDTSRPLNSCEANVLFGASETIYSAFGSGLVDAAVIVSNNLGTIITTNASATQGAVKRMTGLFYTSPSAELMDRCEEAGIIPVFPYTAEIDQTAGVKLAIEKGFKRIAVTVAAADNRIWPEIARLEKEHSVLIYKFGLCSTGISDETAGYMKEYADLVWSCASRAVKEQIEPNAVAQVGLRIPVHIMTENGWDIVRNHLKTLPLMTDPDSVVLTKGDDKPILANRGGKLDCVRKGDIKGCVDCPYPCV